MEVVLVNEKITFKSKDIVETKIAPIRPDCLQLRLVGLPIVDTESRRAEKSGGYSESDAAQNRPLGSRPRGRMDRMDSPSDSQGH